MRFLMSRERRDYVTTRSEQAPCRLALGDRASNSPISTLVSRLRSVGVEVHLFSQERLKNKFHGFSTLKAHVLAPFRVELHSLSNRQFCKAIKIKALLVGAPRIELGTSPV
jgi:hypothetical protein